MFGLAPWEGMLIRLCLHFFPEIGLFGCYSAASAIELVKCGASVLKKTLIDTIIPFAI